VCVYITLCVHGGVQLSFGSTHCMKLLDNAKITLAHLEAHSTHADTSIVPGVFPGEFLMIPNEISFLQLMHVYEFMNDAIILNRDSSNARGGALFSSKS
jgi:hypothetical protein